MSDLLDRKCDICKTPFRPKSSAARFCQNPECKRQGGILSSRRWQAAHPERVRKTAQKWWKNNPDKTSKYRTKRRKTAKSAKTPKSDT